MAGTDEAAASGKTQKEGSQAVEQSAARNDAARGATAGVAVAAQPAAAPELDDFGLPISSYPKPEVESEEEKGRSAEGEGQTTKEPENKPGDGEVAGSRACNKQVGEDTDEQEFKDAQSSPVSETVSTHAGDEEAPPPTPIPPQTKLEISAGEAAPSQPGDAKAPTVKEAEAAKQATTEGRPETKSESKEESAQEQQQDGAAAMGHRREESTASAASAVVTSEFSHQPLATGEEAQEAGDDEGWQTMPAFAPYDIYDDDNKLIAREHDESDDENNAYGGLGGAGKGYTRVMLDEDAQSITSMDENTQYLFKEANSTSMMDDDHQQDAVSQLQATKDLLTEGQRIAYVGLTRLELSAMVKEVESLPITKGTKKQIRTAAEALRMWSQKMMIRLYSHMDISSAEQVMIEQLSEHGVMPRDLTPVLLANARVKNPMAEGQRDSVSGDRSSRRLSSPPAYDQEAASPPPAYEAHAHEGANMPDVKTPSELPTTSRIDIDLRWTVLCDLFLVLIADSAYDARSRVLLERVGSSLDIPWVDICRFEKKVTDALEMQQSAEKENWNEEEHMETRRKLALRKRYVMMGLATVGGGLVIGLSAGLLAPVIGAGLAAGFTTIGVTGTSSFLAGAGGAALITSGAATSGSIIGIKAAERRTGAVKTFEYRPLHNNKRVNLIVTVSGWMAGKVDDVRLPYSTVDPLMGDIYSVLWEPEMLTSMGDTINILATEALTQGLQQLLGNTILVSLMAAIQLPVVLTKLSYLIDNPWAVSLDRATMAGLILADSLIDRNLGTRPVTLVGYSLGSRVIYSCLQELGRKGAYGIVQNVYMFGSPIVAKKEEYLRARTVVSGRFVNAYNGNDWILGYLFRLTNGGIRRISGLAPVDGIPGIENMDVSEFVVGHMDYRAAMPRLLRECGWLVESDEFTEIEDPDPENHTERQRELITEIEEARKELEKEGVKETSKGGIGGFFSRKKQARRQEWEVYEDTMGSKAPGGGPAASSSKMEDSTGNNHGVLFDVDAMRAELAKEQLQVKEIESTLPPMKLDYSPGASPGLAPPMPASPRPANPRKSLRETKSVDASPRHAPRDYRQSEDRTPRFRTTSRSASSYYQSPSYGGEEDDGVQMTFDTNFDDGHTHRLSPPLPPKDDAPTRPGIKTAQTVPNITLSDPWAEEDEDFGEEKEISMTFA